MESSPEITEKKSAGAAAAAHSPRGSIKKSGQKRTISISIASAAATAADGPVAKGGGAGTPPSDSWAWRKYGQKPIKGSPYLRGYYRCSSFKGCPARKQVERSRTDPDTLVVTYSSDHNHPWSNRKTHQNPTAATTAAAEEEEEELAVVAGDIRPPAPAFDGNVDYELDWFEDVVALPPPPPPSSTNSSASSEEDSDTALYGSAAPPLPSFLPDACSDLGGEAAAAAGEEFDFYADLEDLPECSAVLRRSSFLECTG